MDCNDLREDFRLKLTYLTAQYDRMWMRFNFLLGTELAVFGFLGYLTFNVKIPEATVLPIVAGMVLSAIWYVVGAEDHALVEEYRDRVTKAARKLEADYASDHPAVKVENRKGFLTWYWQPLSITRLPAIIGFGLLVTWVILLCTWSEFAYSIAARYRSTP